MQIMQSRRDFLAGLSAAGAASVSAARGSLADEAPPEVTTIRLRKSSAICLAPAIHRRGPAARRGVHRYPLHAGHCRRTRLHMASWTSRCRPQHGSSLELDAGEADHGFGRRASRMLRAVCARAHPRHQRPEGQEGRHPPETRLERASAPCQHRCVCRPRPAHGHRLGEQRDRRLHGAVRRTESRCVSRLPARAAGAARPQDWPRDPQHDHGQAMVAVFLLYGDGQQGLRPQLSGRHQARAACLPQSHRHLRHRAGAGRTASGRCRVHGAIRYTRSRR